MENSQGWTVDGLDTVVKKWCWVFWMLGLEKVVPFGFMPKLQSLFVANNQ